MPAFVDIHCHVLHGLDDGARSKEQSLAMLTLAAASGTTDIIATPHANGKYPFRPDRIAERLAELNGQSPVRLHPGCDFHLQTDNIEDALRYPDRYTLNHGIYLLVEFPDLTIFPNADDIFRMLISNGMVPIVSHPERNPRLQRQPEILDRWVEMGCCVQVTAQSFTGGFGGTARTMAHELMDRDLTHIVASDAHDEKKRTPVLRDAYEYMVRHWGEERVRPLFEDNPRAVLASDTFDIEPRIERRAARRWYQFWK